MTTYYVDDATGHDGNTGLFEAAASEANGSAGDSGTGVSELSETGAFAGYTWASGDAVAIASGTGMTPGTYVINSKTDNDTLVLASDPGDSASAGDIAWRINGSFKTPGFAAQQMGSGDVCYVKSGTYSLTTTTPGAGGPVVLPTSVKCRMEGYYSSAGDNCSGGTLPVLDANAQTGVTLYKAVTTNSSEPQLFSYLKADGQDGAGTTGFELSASGRASAVGCEAVDCPTGFTNGKPRNCTATSCATYGFSLTNGSDATYCTASACGDGFYVAGDNTVHSCLAFGCTDDGFDISAVRNLATNCTAYGNGGDGFDMGTGSSAAHGCVSVGNTGYGFNTSAASILLECATQGNSGGATNTAPLYSDNTALSGDPFAASGSDDFRPDDTAGEGAVLRGGCTGIPGQTDNADIGAVQHTDPTGGGGTDTGAIMQQFVR